MPYRISPKNHPCCVKGAAYELKQKNPGYLVAGERRGIKLPGFDYGNSPKIENLDLTEEL
jgi:2-phosphosulfolactate phosphatase